MRWKFLFGFILIMCFQELSAQEKGTVLVIKDPQIDSLIARRLELNRAGVSGNNVTLSGFRVQIFSGLDRQMAYSEQAKFKDRYPGIKTYISYTQPNYKLRVGDFRTRLEAEKFMNELRNYYNSLFIFSEMIILK
ncbi:MAG: SPOR domain-containing protein [Daejeonella sp.]|uniref:SPOR domain-containing protein n=1 Tax=Daejeonella sp. TaxID=2805397 RepID=UPI002734C737|nr:SPOR domain-containing protein [Daejeonella sp.]MDP3466805.1 SPOR domain-containing protein [Daejeonella sp.]